MTSLTIIVRKRGVPVSGANVIVISKALPTFWKPIPDVFAVKTNERGVAELDVPAGLYLILADDGEDWRAFIDDVPILGSSKTVYLDLTYRPEARYYVKLYLSVPVAQYLAPVVNALSRLLDKVAELAGMILAPLGINIPALELARHVEIESVEGSGNEITIWMRYTGSPVPQAVVIGLIVLAIIVLLVVVAPVMTKWVFGEKVSELPDIFKYISIAITAVAITSIVYMLKKR